MRGAFKIVELSCTSINVDVYYRKLYTQKHVVSRCTSRVYRHGDWAGVLSGFNPVLWTNWWQKAQLCFPSSTANNSWAIAYSSPIVSSTSDDTNSDKVLQILISCASNYYCVRAWCSVTCCAHNVNGLTSVSSGITKSGKSTDIRAVFFFYFTPARPGKSCSREFSNILRKPRRRAHEKSMKTLRMIIE